jgi:ABC-2 type transport system permease protein
MKEIFEALFPGMMYFWLLFIGQGQMQEVVNEKEKHTLERILAAPVTVNQFLLSKMLGCFLLCGIIQVLLVGMSALCFGVHWGNPFHLGMVVVAGALSITGVLAVIHGMARTREQANAMSSMVLVVFGMIGGSMFPFENLPKFMQMVGQFTPNRWGVLAIQGVIRAKPLAELAKPLIILFAIGAVGALLAFKLFRRQLAAAGRGK